MLETFGVADPLPFEKKELLKLQAALVCLGVILTRSFGEAIGKRVEAIVDVFEFSVTIESQEAKRKIGSLLDQTFEAAQKLCDAPGVQGNSIKLGLGAVGIRRRLEVLKTTLTQPTSSLNVPLTLLEWVGDLVWHTLRFCAPMYPAPDDLAFQLSVCQPEAPTASRRPTVGAAASVFDQEDLALTIQKWLRTWAPADRYDSTAFDEAIARALVHALPRDDGGLTGTSTRQMVRSNVRFVPIALDTTFEDGLERVFRERGMPHHVAFPAKVTYEDPEDDDRPKECWILYSDSGGGDVRWVYLASDKEKSSGGQSLETMRFKGPLIVKLNGAPLTPLPSGDELGGLQHIGVASVAHRVVASYSEVMRALGPDSALPAGLEGLLALRKESRRRILCFLGFRLTDSNSRLRIYGLRRGDSAQSSGSDGPFRILFVDSPRDPVQHAFLKLDQSLLEATLEDVAILIRDTDDLSALPEKLSGETR
ncbi:MAG: hypothetical protein DMF56_01630 [Acidobacteria bacterium]|nr:MAG: hypothetical protein DMF56_01630 [Acidobacteriota bacterium]